METNISLYGTIMGPPERKSLRAGPLDMFYENGFLRYIRCGDAEVIRMIYFAVRDHNWDTIEGNISQEKIGVEKDHFKISYTSVHYRDPVDISFQCRIEGDAEGRISFSLDGISGGTFQRNRIGFCVLHPVEECVGKACLIGHPDGTATRSHFPELISPHQPFMNIRSMEWEVSAGMGARLTLEGAVFEAEDQRNWTDASYKTYCTPLGLPFPVDVSPGDEIRQRVGLEMLPAGRGSHEAEKQKHNEGFATATPKDEVFTLHILEILEGGGLPAVGTGESSFYVGTEDQEPSIIRALDLDHLRVEIDTRSPDLAERVKEIDRQQQEFNLPLMLACFFHENPELEYQELLSELKLLGDRIRYFLLFDGSRKTTPGRLINTLVPRIRADFPDALLAGGTNMYFTELNREKVNPADLDGLVYSINPQVHAFDNASLTETLEAQLYTVQSALAYAEGRKILVSPVTLRPRFNPNATGPEPAPREDELPSTVDPRQVSLFGACWTLGSLKYLSEAGVSTVTCFETAGWRGLVQGKRPSPLMEAFHAESGDLFPLYHVFRWLKPYRGKPLVQLKSSAPLIFDGMGFRMKDGYHLFLANFSDQEVRINLPGYVGTWLQSSICLDHFEDLRKNRIRDNEEGGHETDRFRLPPVSVNRIMIKT